MTKLSEFANTLSDGECALIRSFVSRRYLTGFSSSDGTLAVTKTRAVLYLDSRYFEMARIKQKEGLIPEELILSPARVWEEVKDGDFSRILFEDRRETVSALNLLKKALPKALFCPLEDRLDGMRLAKSEEEIRRIGAAQSLAEAAFSYILPRLTVGRSEREIAAELEYYMKKNGASGPSFDTICVSGTRTSLPHGVPTDAPLEKGALVTLDFGCVLDGYASDMTRTVCIGKADDRKRLVYETVLRAQKKALSAIRADVKGSVVDHAAREVIENAGFGPCFGHSTGHGIGLEVHEAPSFSPSYEKSIPAGAVLSVEPGIYLEGEFGVRIEDLAVVTREGHINLNHSSKELLEL